jgi:hypothetical protein
MLCRVPVFRGIAAAHVPAGKAEPQVDPGVASLHAVFTNVRVGFRDLDLICMLTLHLRLRKAFLPMLVDRGILAPHHVKATVN